MGFFLSTNNQEQNLPTATAHCQLLSNLVFLILVIHQTINHKPLALKLFFLTLVQTKCICLA